MYGTAPAGFRRAQHPHAAKRDIFRVRCASLRHDQQHTTFHKKAMERRPKYASARPMSPSAAWKSGADSVTIQVDGSPEKSSSSCATLHVQKNTLPRDIAKHRRRGRTSGDVSRRIIWASVGVPALARNVFARCPDRFRCWRSRPPPAPPPAIRVTLPQNLPPCGSNISDAPDFCRLGKLDAYWLR